MKSQRSQEDYLEAILVIENARGGARSVDVAEYLGFSKPSISRAMALLEAEGYIYFDESRFLRLTSTGRIRARRVYEKHQFFRGILEGIGVAPQTAAEEACLIEHAISDESFSLLKSAYQKYLPAEKTG